MVVSVKILFDKKWRKFPKQLGVLAENINNRTFRSSKKQAHEILEMMQRRIKVFSKTDELLTSLVVDELKTDEKAHRVIIRTASPHALANEEGVTPHWVIYESIPKFQNWVDNYYTGDADIGNPGFIFVGGPNSNIQKGNSKNRFFRISIEEYLRGNRSRSQYVKALKKAMRETFK